MMWFVGYTIMALIFWPSFYSLTALNKYHDMNWTSFNTFTASFILAWIWPCVVAKRIMR